MGARRTISWAKDVNRLNKNRMDTMRKYTPLRKYPILFDPLEALRPEWFAPAFLAASEQQMPEAWRDLLVEHLPGEVYSIPLFSEKFCDMLLEEIFGFYASGLPARRPNSMNNYGIILDDIGLEPFVNKLQAKLQPLGRLLYPGAGSDWDGHHC